MGCFDSFRRQKEVSAEHKFEYINLKDFKSNSFVNGAAYVWVYMSVLIAFLCVAADTYTATILLAFNRWSSQIKPIIPFHVAKVIFAVCIGLSWVLYFIDWWHAGGVIKRGGVADAYMDSIALRWHAIRGGKLKEDTGWKRFLVFARLTEKRGKRDYVALFTYFSFKGWARVLFAEGPRVVINTLTLVSVIRADLIPNGAGETLTVIGRFFENIGHLYNEKKVQALILGTMAFTTILWLFTIIQLIIACMMYLCYLVRVIEDTSLKDYCRKRVDKRMTRIVVENHKQGLKKDVKDFRQPTVPLVVSVQESASLSKSIPVAYLGREPTVPNLERGEFRPQLNRATTSTTTASTTYSSQSSPRTYYPPRLTQHSANNSYDSTTALTAMQSETTYPDPTYPSAAFRTVSPQGRFPNLPQQCQHPTRTPAGEGVEMHQWADPIVGRRTATAPPASGRRWQQREPVERRGTAPPGYWREGEPQQPRGPQQRYWPPRPQRSRTAEQGDW